MAAAPMLNRVTAPIGARNALLHARARRHEVSEYPGPLSIKSVTEGRVAWRCEGRDLTPGPGSFLVLNDGEPYSMRIDEPSPVTTICVFFQRGFVESAAASLTATEIDPMPQSAPLLARHYIDDCGVVRRMQALVARPTLNQLWLDTKFLGLAQSLVTMNRDLRARIERLPARRSSTREELFRRVRRGQEYLHAHACEDLDLAALSRQACLSPFHFHRAFTHLFGQTPHSYRTRLRLAEAKRLIEDTDRTVTEICAQTGFESAPSFSLLFRRHFGESPIALRRAV